MQQEKYKNPFESITKLWRVEFNTRYKHIKLLELMFEEAASATSSYEISSESIEARPQDLWRFICYFAEKPEHEDLKEALEDFLEGELDISEEVESDWVSIVQSQAKPVVTGKFFVANSNLIENCPDELIPIKIDAGRAFGTGEHATTKGCLEMISNLKVKPVTILDVGTGTGVLAIACKKLWNKAEILGTDIDEIAVQIAKENANLNDADIKFGLRYQAENKYDLIVSNILANPLIEMSRDFEIMLKNGGMIILSGFTNQQLPKVVEAYTDLGLEFLETISSDDWRIVLFAKSAHFS